MKYTVKNLTGEIRELYLNQPAYIRQIIQIKEPGMFIDFLGSNSFFAGSMGGKIPVEQTRTIFRIWLHIHDQNK